MKDETYRQAKLRIKREIDSEFERLYPEHAKWRKAKKKIDEWRLLVKALGEDGFVPFAGKVLPDGTVRWPSEFRVFRLMLGIDEEKYQAEEHAIDIERDKYFREMGIRK